MPQVDAQVRIHKVKQVAQGRGGQEHALQPGAVWQPERAGNACRRADVTDPSSRLWRQGCQQGFTALCLGGSGLLRSGMCRLGRLFLF
jgi:hypothetical protein